jgi:hypothetical protein
VINYSTNCKICHKPLTTQADEDGLETPLIRKLVGGLAHDLCHDRAIRRREAGNLLEWCCHELGHLSQSLSADDKLRIKKNMTTGAERYGAVFAEMSQQPAAERMAIDLVPYLMTHPLELTRTMNNYRNKVRQMWRAAKATTPTQESKTP